MKGVDARRFVALSVSRVTHDVTDLREAPVMVMTSSGLFRDGKRI